jgi:ABC-2 type transport system permease protein
MPAGMQWFAENQPFTAFNETLRGLLMGTPIGNSGLLTTTWCAAIAAGGYLWARGLYNRNSVR